MPIHMRKWRSLSAIGKCKLKAHCNPLHTLHAGEREQQSPSTEEGVEQMKLLDAVGGVTWCHCLEKVFSSALHSIAHTHTLSPSNSPLAACPHTMGAYVHQKTSTRRFTAALFRIVKTQEPPYAL